jgi:hypothetical protein
MTVKTAISIDRTLFQEAEAMAGEMKVSRSRLVGLALAEFLKRHRARTMLDQLNAVYAGASPDEPAEAAKLRRASHRRRVEGTW